ncbi:MAG: hypothetical protein SVZ03_11540 [Spirochaetota bacterium]|nr:hypothetical protein [Spirochaetota bacterium]
MGIVKHNGQKSRLKTQITGPKRPRPESDEAITKIPKTTVNVATKILRHPVSIAIIADIIGEIIIDIFKKIFKTLLLLFISVPLIFHPTSQHKKKFCLSGQKSSS